VLVIHPGALGDVLLAVPALRALRAAHPRERVMLGATPRVGELLVALGIVDEAVDVERLGLDRLFVESAGLPAAVVTGARTLVSWFGSRDPGFVRRLRELVPDAVVAPSIPSEGPIWPHLLQTVGGPDGDWRRPVHAPAELRDEGRSVLRDLGWDGVTRLVLVHPGAGGYAKCWPAAGFVQVIAHALDAGADVVVHRGPASADVDAAAALRRRLDTRVRWLEAPSLVTLAGVLAHASAYVGNDSGISHLAATVGCRALVLFTPELARWASWSPTAQPLTISMASVTDDTLVEVTTRLEALWRAQGLVRATG
jgi:ADP-heptose:LPS heptosyltransferase